MSMNAAGPCTRCTRLRGLAASPACVSLALRRRGHPDLAPPRLSTARAPANPAGVPVIRGACLHRLLRLARPLCCRALHPYLGSCSPRPPARRRLARSPRCAAPPVLLTALPSARPSLRPGSPAARILPCSPRPPSLLHLARPLLRAAPPVLLIAPPRAHPSHQLGPPAAWLPLTAPPPASPAPPDLSTERARPRHATARALPALPPPRRLAPPVLSPSVACARRLLPPCRPRVRERDSAPPVLSTGQSRPPPLLHRHHRRAGRR